MAFIYRELNRGKVIPAVAKGGLDRDSTIFYFNNFTVLSGKFNSYLAHWIPYSNHKNMKMQNDMMLRGSTFIQVNSQ